MNDLQGRRLTSVEVLVRWPGKEPVVIGTVTAREGQMLSVSLVRPRTSMEVRGGTDGALVIRKDEP